MRKKHNELCIDLADYKKTIFINAPLGSVWGYIYDKRNRQYEISRQLWDEGEHDMRKIKEIYEEGTKDMGVPIADVVVVRPSYTNFCIDIYEVKASRSDFVNSLSSGKWKKYLPHCNRFYFALDSGFAYKKEIPEDVGLIIKGRKGWHTIKRAKDRDFLIPYGTLMSLLFYRQKVKYMDNKRKEDS